MQVAQGSAPTTPLMRHDPGGHMSGAETVLKALRAAEANSLNLVPETIFFPDIIRAYHTTQAGAREGMEIVVQTPEGRQTVQVTFSNGRAKDGVFFMDVTLEGSHPGEEFRLVPSTTDDSIALVLVKSAP